MSPTTRAQNKNPEKETNKSSNTTANTSEASVTSNTGQATGQSVNTSTNTEASTASQTELQLPNPIFSRPPPSLDTMCTAQSNSVIHLFGAMSEVHGVERAAEEWAKFMPGPILEKLRSAHANIDSELAARTQNLTLRNTSVNTINANTSETQNTINDSQLADDTQNNLLTSTPRCNNDSSSSSGSVASNDQSNATGASNATNSNNTNNSFSFSKEELAQLLVQAARKNEHGEVFNNVSLQRIPELYAYGSSPNGTRTARPQLVFQKIEEIYGQESQRKDALRLRVRGLASNYLYDLLASNPSATYEEQKQALLRRFKVKLTKTEYMARFQNLKKGDNETLSNYVERINRLANSFRETNIESVSEELIDNLSCAALFPFIPLWLHYDLKIDGKDISDMKFPILWESVRERIERAYTTRAQFKGNNPITTVLDEPWQELENPYANDLEHPEIASLIASQQALPIKQPNSNPTENKKVRFSNDTQSPNRNQQTGQNTIGQKRNGNNNYTTPNPRHCTVTRKPACNYHCFQRQNSFNYRNNKPYYNNSNHYRFNNRPAYNNFNRNGPRFPTRGFTTNNNRPQRSPNREFQRFPLNRESQGGRNPGQFQGQNRFPNPNNNQNRAGTPDQRPGTPNSLLNQDRRPKAGNTQPRHSSNLTQRTPPTQVSTFEWEDENLLSMENFY